MRRLIVLSLVLVATPAAADPCEQAFRAGMAAYRQADQRLTTVEETLYAGIGWATRARVLERLENRSALTSGCQEVSALSDSLARAQVLAQGADQSFGLATALCMGVNQERAQGNIDALSDTLRDIRTQADYLSSLSAQCSP